MEGIQGNQGRSKSIKRWTIRNYMKWFLSQLFTAFQCFWCYLIINLIFNNKLYKYASTYVSALSKTAKKPKYFAIVKNNGLLFIIL